MIMCFEWNLCCGKALLGMLVGLLLTACSSAPLQPGTIKYFAKQKPRGPVMAQKPLSKRVKKEVRGWTVLSNSPTVMEDYFASLRTDRQGIARNVDIIVRMPHCWLLVACESKDTLYQPEVSE